jgi:hypothetical protein
VVKLADIGNFHTNLKNRNILVNNSRNLGDFIEENEALRNESNPRFKHLMAPFGNSIDIDNPSPRTPALGQQSNGTRPRLADAVSRTLGKLK